MRLNHFFENMVRREEMASAFLATLLAYDRAFRGAFLRLALDDPVLDELEAWKVQVEEDRVDVTLDSPSTLILIENKIGSGAKQVDQLLRYYLAAAGARPGKRIVAVYLAPRGIGMDEVDRVRRAELFIQRPSDAAHHIPWESLTAIVERLPQSETSWFARSAMDAINSAIERAHRERYPALGDRALVRQIMDNAQGLLGRRSPDVRIGRWSARDFEEILTYGTPVTLWLDAVFEVEGETPFLPTGVDQPDGVHLEVRSMFKLAGRVQKTSELGRRWDQLVRAGSVDVSGIGRHDLRPDHWFAHTKPIVANAEDVETAVADTGQYVLEFLSPFFALSTAPH